jgi:4-alpha-glucanotransferase
MHTGVFRRELARLRGSARLHYEWVMALKRSVLDILFRVFVERQSESDRGREFASWVSEQGQSLVDFATYCALDEKFGRPPASFGPRGPRQGHDDGAASWREWPEPYRYPRSAAVTEFRTTNAERVTFFQWLQFELDRQLAAAARRATDAGMPIGVYQDLAIGSSPDGFDTWANPELFVTGVNVGAPPDPLAPEGQDWGLPPMDPRRLAEDGYRFWVRLLRGAFQHAGALRIDHVMGLFRLFWIPRGMSGKDGAYLRYPVEDLLGILALESTRAGALVVGEDLGTVPEEVPAVLDRWGLLSSRVLYFERDAEGFRPARAYPAKALTTANTHDLPTLAGFWQGQDIALRREVGLLTSDAELRRARQTRSEDRRQLVALLAHEGLLPDERSPQTSQDLRVAVHTFLRRTPSWLVGLSLDDLVGEEKPVNLPGVGPDRYPSWTRRLSVSLEALRGASDIQRVLGRERDWLR